MRSSLGKHHRGMICCTQRGCDKILSHFVTAPLLSERHCRFLSGGDEENRTPVRKHCFIGFSERSLCFNLRIRPPTDRLPSSDFAKSSPSSLRKSALEYPAVVLLSAQAGAKRTEAGVKPPERSLRLLLCLNKSFTLLTG